MIIHSQMDKKVVHSVFDHISYQYGNLVAIEESTRSITYSNLRKYSNKIAHCILSTVSQKGEVVGVFMDAGIDYVGSILGVNKSGGIWMPLDKSYPINRLVYILNFIKPKVIIVNKENKDELFRLLKNQMVITSVEKIIIVKGEDASFTVYEHKNNSYVLDYERFFFDTDIDVRTSGDDSSYLLYTSGSTGNPKAIEGKNSGLSHFIHWEINEFGIGEGTKVSQLAPLLFDVSLRDIFVPLLSGGTLCIPDKETKSDPEKLIHWIGKNQINLLHIVPSIFRLIIKEIQSNGLLLESIKHLKNVLLAGEPLYGKDVTAWRELGATAELCNLYGPTETTLAKVFNRIQGETYEPSAVVPLGKPITNTMIILIKNNNLCEVGEIGEIYIKTPFRSKGYYHDPILTRELFIQNPLHDNYEDIVYKTGDLGRYLSDRSIEYIGRKDTQIKIRGNRVELVEVEKSILAYNGIDQTVVRPVQNAEGETLLTCYYTESEPIVVEELKNYIGKDLPDYMHPSFYICLPEFTLNVNGKLDKSALPKPEDLLYDKVSYESPRNELEMKLCEICSEILGLKKIGIRNSFFALGGHSLRATKAISKIYKEIGKEISLKDFFENSSVIKLAEFLNKSEENHFKLIELSPYQEYYDISHAQKRLWILHQIEEERKAYNLISAYLVQGKLNKIKFQKTFEEIIRRHESLRTTFAVISGEPKQRIRDVDDVEFGFECLDLTSHEYLEEKVKEIANQEEEQEFDLEKGPLLRVKLLQVSDEQFVVVLTMHHIISDAWSMKVFTNEFFKIYESLDKNLELDIPPLRIHYKDFAKWQNDILHENNGKHSQYWLNQFKGEIPVLNLISDYSRPKIKTYNGNSLYTLLGKDVLDEIESLNSKSNTTLFMFVVAAVKALLHRYTADKDIVVGSPIAGRNHPDLEDQIGYYVNTLALRTHIDGNESFEGLLLKVRDVVLGAYEHQSYPFDQLVENLNIPKDMSRSPLFDVMVVLHNAEIGNSEVSGIEGIGINQYQYESKTSKFDLTFSFSKVPDGLSVKLEYNTDLFTEIRISCALEHFKNLVIGITKYKNDQLNKLGYLSKEEKVKLISSNKQKAKFPSNTTIPQLFEEQVALEPDGVAVVFDGKILTYKELNDKSNQLARFLKETYSIQSNDFIGLMMDRSENMVVVLLAILKAGAAYVALDPSYPEDRIRYILEDTKVKVLVREMGISGEGMALEDYPVLFLNNISPELNKFSKADLENTTSSTDLAYIIYTSGSTGKPKGVMVEHRNVVQLFFNEFFPFSFSKEDVWSLFHSINFDFSVWEIFGALLFGGRLIVIPKDATQSPEVFTEILIREKVTVLNQIPAIFKNLLPQLIPIYKELHLRYVIFGGEALNPAILRIIQSLCPTLKFINMYGITETTVHTTFKEITFEDIELGISNIGFPLPTASIYLLDENLQLVPEGVSGEITVSGAGLARGYLNQEQLTESRFIPNPFIENERVYLSGDLGVRLPNGEIIYKGRKDYQIKLNGFRIEVGEIENVLISHSDIEDAIVLVKENEIEVKHLIAYLITKAKLKTSDLRAFLSSRIPAYMIPSYFILLEEFPLTVSGKVDRKLLPNPKVLSSENESSHVSPTNFIEEILVEAFEKILGRTNVGIQDNFFTLGGDSIKAIQVASKLHNEGYKVTVREIFQNPSIEELAPFVKKLDRIADQSPIVGDVPLTPIQKQFFVVPKNNYNHYNQSIMLYSAQGFELEATKAVFEKIQEHHDILRATFINTGSSVLQSNNGVNYPVSIECIDLRSGDLTAFYKCADILQSSIDLQKGPLMKLALFKFPDGDRLLIVIHHLVIDGVSWRILLEDIGILFEQHAQGIPLTLQKKTDSFKVWAEKLTSFSNAPLFLKEKNYWKEIISQSFYPINREFKKETPNYIKDTKTLTFNLTEEETENLLTRVNQAFNTEINDILLTALGLSIKEVFACEKLLISLEGHGREEILKDVDISRTVGWFTSIYPILLDLSYEADLSRQIVEIKEGLRKIPGKGIGFGMLKYLTREEFKEGFSHEVRPQISFNYLGQFDTDEANSSFEISEEYKGLTKSHLELREYEFDVSGMITSKKLIISIEYNTNHFSTETIKKLIKEYNSNLSLIIEHCASIETSTLTPSDLGFSDLSIQDLDTFFD